MAIKTASLSSQRHFIESFTAYLDSVVQQAGYRDDNTSITIEAYLKNRRENIGARPSYVPMETDLELPDEVFYHPVIVELSVYIADLIILDNVSLHSRLSDTRNINCMNQDIASYNKEQATGDDRHNILTVAMHDLQTDFEGALEWVVNYHAEVETKFLDGLKRVPSWGREIDGQLERYQQGLANWPRCNDCWNFESGRYFGNKGLEIQKTRRVTLLPRAVFPSRDTLLRQKNVIIPLVEELESTA